jgi:hypothetical protein
MADRRVRPEEAIRLGFGNLRWRANHGARRFIPPEPNVHCSAFDRAGNYADRLPPGLKKVD